VDARRDGDETPHEVERFACVSLRHALGDCAPQIVEAAARERTSRRSTNVRDCAARVMCFLISAAKLCGARAAASSRAKRRFSAGSRAAYSSTNSASRAAPSFSSASDVKPVALGISRSNAIRRRA